MLKKKYIVQVYDEDGNACKMPRYFEGTEEEVKQYIHDRFGLVDAARGRTTRYYETRNEEDIPQKIDIEKVSDGNEEYVRQLVKNTFEEQISEEIKKHLDSGIIFKYISDIENELQSYKQKEDKLRELVEENKHIYYTEDEAVEDCVIDGKYILQILNEGSDL